METLILLLLPFISLSQTTRLDYFRTKVDQGEVILNWATFVEDGADVFTVSKSQDANTWDVITTVEAKQVKDGATYEINVGNLTGVWYYGLTWKNGYKYATSTILVKSHIYGFNILGQVATTQLIQLN